jgi:hypothetical protein
MEFRDLVTLYFERSNEVQTLWNLYITVVVGLLALFGAIKQSRQKVILAGIVSLGFLAFAYVNEDALQDVTHARRVTQGLINNYNGTDCTPQMKDRIHDIVTPPTETQLESFHFLCDVLVLIAIWGLTLEIRLRSITHHRRESRLSTRT